MPLGKEVVFGPGHIVLNGDPVGTQPPTAAPSHFRPMPIVAKWSPISATAEYLFSDCQYMPLLQKYSRTKLCDVVQVAIFTGTIARSAKRRYLSYSEVFRPAGVTHCIYPHRFNDKGIGPSKLKFLLRYDQNVEYKRPAGAYPLRDFWGIS